MRLALVSLTFIYCFGFISCSKYVSATPVEYFSGVAPMQILLQSSYTKTKTQWFVNGQHVSDENLINLFVIQAGRYEIVHKITKSGKVISNHVYQVVAPIECNFLMYTNVGLIHGKLYNETPEHRDNFARLVDKGFYTQMPFHRVIKGFVAQVGDERYIDKTQAYRIDKTIKAEITLDHFHTRGALAMARVADDDNPEKASSSTQFYIVDGNKISDNSLIKYQLEKDIEYPEETIKKYKKFGGTPQLDKEYTVFGELISGYDTLDKIMQVATDQNDFPKENIIIEKIIMIL